MFPLNKLVQVSFLLIVVFSMWHNIAFCQTPPPRDTTGESAHLRDSLKSEMDSLRSELHKIDELKDEFSELKIKVANKYIDFTTLIIALIALFAGGSGFASWIAHKSVRRASLKIRKALRESELAKKEIEHQKQESIALKKEFESDIKKSMSSIDRLTELFRMGIDRNTEIMAEFLTQYIKLLGLEIDTKKLGEVFDKIYQSKMHLYDIQGFLSDLASDDKDARIRSIWGIEGMGKVENIKDLQKIVDNPHEDPDIRVEAQKAVDNMKRRFGIQ